MKFRSHGTGDEAIAELLGEGIIVSSVSVALDLIGNAGARNIVLQAEQLHPDFFKLRTGLAGEILQKFTNYRVRLSIVGDFGSLQSPALRDFIRESNDDGQISFVASLDAALAALRGK
ncbi:MAG: DUF4180 domain-containing protein [Spirochaetota bacterium]